MGKKSKRDFRIIPGFQIYGCWPISLIRCGIHRAAHAWLAAASDTFTDMADRHVLRQGISLTPFALKLRRSVICLQRVPWWVLRGRTSLRGADGEESLECCAACRTRRRRAACSECKRAPALINTITDNKVYCVLAFVGVEHSK